MSYSREGGPKRSSRHDEICVWALEQPDLSVEAFDADELYVGVEEEIDNGFADIYIKATGTPEGNFHVLVEVKTKDENPSAGDIIHQLKWYRRDLKKALAAAGREGEPIRLVCVHEGEPTEAAKQLLAHAGITLIVAPTKPWRGL